jgi:2-aminomuconate deaminase
VNAGSPGDALPPPLGNYPRYRRAGRFIFVSGISARLADGSIDGVTLDSAARPTIDVGKQTRKVFDILGQVLESAGATLADCVDLTCLLTDMADFAEFNRVYAELMAGMSAPARTTYAVSALPHRHMVIEIKAVAYLPAAIRG